MYDLLERETKTIVYERKGEGSGASKIENVIRDDNEVAVSHV